MKGTAGYSLADYGLGPRKLPLARQGGLPHQMAFSELGNALDAIAGGGKHQLKALAWDAPKGLLHIGYARQLGDSPATNDLWIDPERNWRVVESRGETQSGVFTDVVSYGIPVEELEFPTGFKNVTKYKVSDAPPDLDITGRVISVKVADQRPEAFRLSAFGLPEPVDAPAQAKSTPRYVWFLIAAGIFGALAIGFRYLVRGQTPTPA